MRSATILILAGAALLTLAEPQPPRHLKENDLGRLAYTGGWFDGNMQYQEPNPNRDDDILVIDNRNTVRPQAIVSEKVLFVNTIPYTFTDLSTGQVGRNLCFKYGLDEGKLDTWVPNPLEYGESMQVEIVGEMMYANWFWTINTTICSDETVVQGGNLTRPLMGVALDAGAVLDDTVFTAGVSFFFGSLFPYLSLLNRFLPPTVPDTTIAEIIVNSAVGYECEIFTRTRDDLEVWSPFQQIGNQSIGQLTAYVAAFDDCEDAGTRPKSYRANCTNLLGTQTKAFTIDITEKLGCEGSYNPFIILGSGLPFDGDNFPPQIIHVAPNCTTAEVCLVTSTEDDVTTKVVTSSSTGTQNASAGGVVVGVAVTATIVGVILLAVGVFAFMRWRRLRHAERLHSAGSSVAEMMPNDDPKPMVEENAKADV